MPCCMSCFSKAFLFLRTLLPRVRYIQSKLRAISVKCGKDFVTVVNIETALVNKSTTILGKRSLLFFPTLAADMSFKFSAYFVLFLMILSAFSSTSKHVAEARESPQVLFSHLYSYRLRQSAVFQFFVVCCCSFFTLSCTMRLLAFALFEVACRVIAEIFKASLTGKA